MKAPRLAVLVPVLLSLWASCLYAQKREINKRPNTSTCVLQPVSPLNILPPLRPDMSEGCLNGYLFFDSACRTKVTRGRLDTLTAKIDTWEKLRPLMRYKYLMSEYDATLFDEYQYGWHGLTATPFVGPGVEKEYYMGPAIVDMMITDAAETLIGRRNKLVVLADADMILRIHVESIILKATNHETFPLHCVTAQVVDTIKGKHIRQCYGVGPSSPSCISFSFSPNGEKEYGSDVVDVFVDDSGNSHVYCNNCYSDTSIFTGRDYIVFLDNIIDSYDGAFAYYYLWPYRFFSAEGGIFPILANGNVSIPSDYFKYGREVPYERFIELLRKDINSIIQD